jgi:hypothetical protein
MFCCIPMKNSRRILKTNVDYTRLSLTSCYVLSKLTVLHHSSLNCLRRIVAILVTSLYFQKSMSTEAILGLLTSFLGFAAFIFYRHQRTSGLKTKDSHV